MAKELLSACVVLCSGRCLKVEGLKGLACLEGACVFLRPWGVIQSGKWAWLQGTPEQCSFDWGWGEPELGLGGVISEAPARRQLEGGPIPLCSASPFC